MEQNFCRRCGSALQPANHGGYRCKNNHLIFSNSAPTVGAFLVDSEGKLLLSIRGIEPSKGSLDTIGGFVDLGETFEEALIREIREESGLEPSDYSPLHYLTSALSHYEFGGETREVLSCFYTATLSDGVDPRASDDVAELVRLEPRSITLDQFGTGNDVRTGFVKFLEVNP